MVFSRVTQSVQEKELGARIRRMGEQKIREMEEAKRVQRNARGLAALKSSGALRELNVTDVEGLAHLPDDILSQLLRPKATSAVTQNFGTGTSQDYAQQAAAYLSGGELEGSDTDNQNLEQYMPQVLTQSPQTQQQFQEANMRDVLGSLQRQNQFNPVMQQMFNPKQAINLPQQALVTPQAQQEQQPTQMPQQIEGMQPVGIRSAKKPKMTEQQVANKLSEYARVKYGGFKPKSVDDVAAIEQDLLNKKNELLGLPTKAEREQYEKEFKPLNDAIDKKFNALNEMAPKAGKMLELLREGNVASGVSGKYLPTWYLGKDSEDFAGASDDIAAGLTALQTGVQSIGKIKFNQQRKPNLGQSFEGQLARTYSLLEDITRGYLEHDLSQYLLQENQGVYKDYKADLKSYYNRLSTKVPTPTSDDQEGDEVIGKDGSLWVLEGPVYRFKGFKKGK